MSSAEAVDLGNAGAPPAIVDFILAWIFEAGAIDLDRLANAQGFVRALQAVPVSAGAAACLWRSFIRTMGDAAKAAAPRWVEDAELAGDPRWPAYFDTGSPCSRPSVAHALPQNV